jgi:hypothetical protein
MIQRSGLSQCVTMDEYRRDERPFVLNGQQVLIEGDHVVRLSGGRFQSDVLAAIQFDRRPEISFPREGKSGAFQETGERPP